MKRAHFVFAGLSGVLLLAGSFNIEAQQIGPFVNRMVFNDNFEVERPWSMYEEIVDRCYVDAVGQVSRSTDYALTGRQSLRISANQARSIFNNHVIGGYKVADAGRNGRWRYQVYSFI